METIKESTLRVLSTTGSLVAVSVVGTEGGFEVRLAVGKAQNVLSSTRGEIRLFTLSSAAEFLKSFGILTFTVDVTHYKPGRLRKARPDRAEALKKTRTKPVQSSLI